MAGAHEQSGLREPRDGAAQVGTIDGENKELRIPLVVQSQVADVNPCQSGHAVPWHTEGIVEVLQPSFVDRKPIHRAQVDPRDFFLFRTPTK